MGFAGARPPSRRRTASCAADSDGLHAVSVGWSAQTGACCARPATLQGCPPDGTARLVSAATRTLAPRLSAVTSICQPAAASERAHHLGPEMNCDRSRRWRGRSVQRRARNLEDESTWSEPGIISVAQYGMALPRRFGDHEGPRRLCPAATVWLVDGIPEESQDCDERSIRDGDV
jgi:hypothetical protein